MRRALLALLALLAACSDASKSRPAEVGAPCRCAGVGVDVLVDYDTVDGQCPVTDLDFWFGVVGAESVTRNDVVCTEPSPVSQGAHFVLPWRAGALEDELGTVTVHATSPSGARATGSTTFKAAPGTCASVVVHAICAAMPPAFADAAPAPAGAAASLAAR